MEQSMISDFGYALLFIVGGIVFLIGGFVASFLIRPDRPNEEKLTTYECGEDPIGNAWSRFNVRFYIIALIFILFDVEIVFLFPWATVFGQKELIAMTNGTWGWFALFEMCIFIFILALGLAYAWRKGFLDWVKPEAKVRDLNSKIPQRVYDKVNERYAKPSLSLKKNEATPAS